MNDPRVTSPIAGQPADATTRGILPVGATPAATVHAGYLTQAFVWMVAGLLLSAGLAFITQSNEPLLRFAANNFLLLIVVQFALVFAIQLGVRRVGATAGLGLFFVYAASVGLTLGLIVAGLELGSVVTAFLSAAAVFGAAAFYGRVTKRSLAGIGGVLFIGLIGLIAASLLNLLFADGGFSFVISIAGVGLFTVLTAYDVQRIQNGDLVVYTGSAEKAAVLGAVHLYLDFLNLFLFLLNLQGGNRE